MLMFCPIFFSASRFLHSTKMLPRVWQVENSRATCVFCPANFRCSDLPKKSQFSGKRVVVKPSLVVKAGLKLDLPHPRWTRTSMNRSQVFLLSWKNAPLLRGTRILRAFDARKWIFPRLTQIQVLLISKWEEQGAKRQRSKPHMTFHSTGWSIGILIFLMA